MAQLRIEVNLLDHLKERKEEYGAILPTDHAKNRLLDLLKNTIPLMNDPFPDKGIVTVSFEGGLRLQWFYPKESVRIVIPAEKGPTEYIFFETEDYFDTELATPQNLANRLQWLKKEREK